jgi:hypothetical protein
MLRLHEVGLVLVFVVLAVSVWADRLQKRS